MPVLLKFFAFAALSLVLGLGSAWYMIDPGTALTTTRVGAWETWRREGMIDADPYTQARTARSGRLPVTTATALYFTARHDDDGYTLTSGCDYEIIGRSINSLWWSITLYDSNGDLIANKAERHSFNSQNISLQSNGEFRIAVSSAVKPGNWLPSGRNNDLILMLRVIRPVNAARTTRTREPESLPQIKRIDC